MWIDEPPADCQKVWHEWAGNFFKNKIILDIGAGNGKSKERMSKNGNHIYTQDINRAMMNNVDYICDYLGVKTYIQNFDIVTAFDVIEHIDHYSIFIDNLFRLCKEGSFVTTPNRWVINRDWHFYPAEFVSFARLCKYEKLRFFGRYKNSNSDEIKELKQEEFIQDAEMYGMGIYVEKK